MWFCCAAGGAIAALAGAAMSGHHENAQHLPRLFPEGGQPVAFLGLAHTRNILLHIPYLFADRLQLALAILSFGPGLQGVSFDPLVERDELLEPLLQFPRAELASLQI